MVLYNRVKALGGIDIKADFRVINAPYHVGCELQFDLITEADVDIRLKNTNESAPVDEIEKTALVGRAIRDAAFDALSQGTVPFLWAGDCIAPISVITALQQVDIYPKLIWFASHGDFNTRETSWTGYLAG